MRQHPGQRVERIGIEAGGDDDQLGPEALQRRQDDAVQRGERALVATAGKQGDVDVGPLPGPFAAFGDGAGAGGIAGVLVQRDGEGIGAVPVDRLRAVAVVDVPVDDGDLGQAVAYQSGAMVRVSGPNIILSPPLVITEADAATILAALDAGLAALS